MASRAEIKAASEVIAAHVEVPEEAQPDLYLTIAREALEAAESVPRPDPHQRYPASRFAHRFKDDGWPR